MKGLLWREPFRLFSWTPEQPLQAELFQGVLDALSHRRTHWLVATEVLPGGRHRNECRRADEVKFLNRGLVHGEQSCGTRCPYGKTPHADCSHQNKPYLYWSLQSTLNARVFRHIRHPTRRPLMQ